MLRYCFLCYHPKTERLDLIGYPLTLSKTDRAILMFLLKQGGKSSLDEMLHLCPRARRKATLAVHLHRINRRAALISRRPLVLCRDGICHLNPHM